MELVVTEVLEPFIYVKAEMPQAFFFYKFYTMLPSFNY